MADMQAQVPREVVHRLLMHDGLTRRQIAEAFDVSMPAVTRYIRWLDQHDLILSHQLKLVGVKRPVEVMRLNPDKGLALAVMLEADRLDAQLLLADGSVLKQWQKTFDTPGQTSLMNALRHMVRTASRQAGRLDIPLYAVGLSVDGYVEPTSGMVFHVRGIEPWEPCLPRPLISGMQDLSFVPWTRAASRMHGLAWQYQLDDGVGYLGFDGKRLSIASMKAGRTHLGRLGTSSTLIHQKVSRDPTVCYCGLKGCLSEHLRQGNATPMMLAAALPNVIKYMEVQTLGLDWARDARQVVEAAYQAGVEKVIQLEDSSKLAVDGLRFATTRLLLRRLVDDLLPTPTRRLVNPEALRKRPVFEVAISA